MGSFELLIVCPVGLGLDLSVVVLNLVEPFLPHAQLILYLALWLVVTIFHTVLTDEFLRLIKFLGVCFNLSFVFYFIPFFEILWIGTIAIVSRKLLCRTI